MKDPCDECIVKACCIDYCENKISYNKKTLELYRNGINKPLFEKAINDAILIHKKKHGAINTTFTRKRLKKLILETEV